MDIKQVAGQIQTIATLYSDILLCLLAASVLGWFVGLMMQRSRHKKQLSQHNAQWQERYQTLEDTSRSDTENLEEQLQSLAKETKSLQATNRALTESLQKNDTNVQKSRAEAIELNRQHTETHERLQRIIQHKDREIAELGNRLSMDSHALRKAASPAVKAKASTYEPPPSVETDLDNADTIAIIPSQLAGEVMDATVQMSVPTPHPSSEQKPDSDDNIDADASLDDTSNLSDASLEESTIAMDEEALAFAQRSIRTKRE